MTVAGKYRKKPVVIDAVEFVLNDGSWDTGGRDATRTHVVEMWLSQFDVDLSEWVFAPDRIEIPTLEGVMRAQPGDWIIRGVQGEFYPCKPDIFETTYEAVEDGYMSPDERLREFGAP